MSKKLISLITLSIFVFTLFGQNYLFALRPPKIIFVNKLLSEKDLKVKNENKSPTTISNKKIFFDFVNSYLFTKNSMVAPHFCDTFILIALVAVLVTNLFLIGEPIGIKLIIIDAVITAFIFLIAEYFSYQNFLSIINKPYSLNEIGSKVSEENLSFSVADEIDNESLAKFIYFLDRLNFNKEFGLRIFNFKGCLYRLIEIGGTDKTYFITPYLFTFKQMRMFLYLHTHRSIGLASSEDFKHLTTPCPNNFILNKGLLYKYYKAKPPVTRNRFPVLVIDNKEKIYYPTSEKWNNDMCFIGTDHDFKLAISNASQVNIIGANGNTITFDKSLNLIDLLNKTTELAKEKKLKFTDNKLLTLIKNNKFSKLIKQVI